MNLEQANELAARIRAQFPHVEAAVVQRADMRNAPRNWFISVERSGEPEGAYLHIHNENEWVEAVKAWFVLNK